jgi:hypothetical protein
MPGDFYWPGQRARPWRSHLKLPIHAPGEHAELALRLAIGREKDRFRLDPPEA